MSVTDSSTVKGDETILLFNTVFESGGAFICEDSTVNITRGYFKGNNAEINGGGLHLVSCSATVDNTSFLYNNATEYRGSVYAKSSLLEMHNTIGQGGLAKDMSGMAMITFHSTFKSWNTFMIFESNNVINSIVVANSSVAVIQHLIIAISPEFDFCPVMLVRNSNATVEKVYRYKLNSTLDSQMINPIHFLDKPYSILQCTADASKYF